MSTVVIFNEGNNRVKAVLPSAHTPNYEGRSDVVINPDLSGIVNVPGRYWKHSSGSIVEMTQQEKEAVDLEAGEEVREENIAREVVALDRIAQKEILGLIVEQFNTLRAFHGLPALTKTQVRDTIRQRIRDSIE